jgi:hypothetical protein
MTIEEIEKRVQQIKEIADDDEMAHIKEDDLRNDVLIAISKGVPNAEELAYVVLKTGQIEFSRWCA